MAGDDAAACRLVATFAETLGCRARLAGPLRHAKYLEGLAHLNNHGRFADLDASSAEVATGTYAVTWVREGGRWLIRFHGWNSQA